MARTMSGKVITAVASAAPLALKASSIPKRAYSQCPNGPRVPNNTSSTYPTATGGSTRGRCTKASNSMRPGKRLRVRIHATSTASGKLHSTLRPATVRLNRSASSSAAPR